jgi:hypothetical protein
MAAVKLKNGQNGDLALNHVAEEHVTGVENVVLLVGIGVIVGPARFLPNGQHKAVIHIVVKVSYDILVI